MIFWKDLATSISNGLKKQDNPKSQKWTPHSKMISLPYLRQKKKIVWKEAFYKIFVIIFIQINPI